ncbi:MAG: WbuC family cupin fold metalloprotein [Sphingobacteriales bacterium]|nr:WbuC family cupin fold metalloprotein [Sphingobacteriales bacterium]
MIKISENLLDKVSSGAKESSRKRQHFNFHQNYQESIQRLINAFEPDSYFRPHNHTDSGITEILILIRGSFVVVIFDDFGEILDYSVISKDSGCYGVEIQPHEWHSTIALEPETVMYEVKQGPFDENRAKVFAPWSPEENSEESKQFNQLILKKLGINS